MASATNHYKREVLKLVYNTLSNFIKKTLFRNSIKPSTNPDNHTKKVNKVNWPRLFKKIKMKHITQPSQAPPNNVLRKHIAQKYWKATEEFNNYLQLMNMF